MTYEDVKANLSAWMSARKIEDIENLDLIVEPFYGLRGDNRNLEVGEMCGNSHQLFQDVQYDDNDELIDYPLLNGFFDAGELEGTCAIEIERYADGIKRALRYALRPNGSSAYGDHLYIISGEEAFEGYDPGEIIIRDARVVAKIF